MFSVTSLETDHDELFLVTVFSSGCMGQHGALDAVFHRLFRYLANHPYSTGYDGPGESRDTHTPARSHAFSHNDCI